MFLFSKTRLKYAWIATSIWVSVLILANVIHYFQNGPTPNFLLEKGSLRFDPFWSTAFYFHIIGAGICLAVGPFLMVPRLIRFRRLHATLGYAYLNSVLWIAAPAGLIISPVSNGGLWAAMGFVLTGIAWWFSTWLGYRAIRSDDLTNHIKWMVRSYSIALSAVWFRIIQCFLSFVFDNSTSYILGVWISLLVSVWCSETCISRHFGKSKKARNLATPITKSTQSFFLGNAKSRKFASRPIDEFPRREAEKYVQRNSN